MSDKEKKQTTNYESLEEIVQRIQSKLRPLSPEEANRREAEAKAQQAAADRAKAEELFRASGIPPLHRDRKVGREGRYALWTARLSTLLEKMAPALARISERLVARHRPVMPGAVFGIFGARGPGKTQLATELLRHASQKLLTVRYVTLKALLAERNATFNNNSPKTESDVLDEYAKAAVMVLDETSKGGASSEARAFVDELVDRRYRTGKVTILIANQQPTAFAKEWPSIADRINEAGGVIVCDWPSFR